MGAAVLVLSWLLALLVTVLYIRWVLARYRRERDEKAARRLGATPRAQAPPPAPRPAASVMPTAMPTTMPTATPAPIEPIPGSTVAAAVRGVSLPCNLAPLIEVPVNEAALDRATFVTRGYAVAVVIEELGRALEAIGQDVRWVDGRGLARKGEAELQIAVHQAPRLQGFATAPEDGIVVDLWIAAR